MVCLANTPIPKPGDDDRGRDLRALVVVVVLQARELTAGVAGIVHFGGATAVDAKGVEARVDLRVGDGHEVVAQLGQRGRIDQQRGFRR